MTSVIVSVPHELCGTQAFFDAAQESMFQPVSQPFTDPHHHLMASKILISFSSLNTGLTFNGMNLTMAQAAASVSSSASREGFQFSPLEDDTRCIFFSTTPKNNDLSNWTPS